MVVKEKEVNWIAYFSLNNIELDVMLNTMFINFSEKRACTFKDYISRTIFDKLNPNLVYKLVNKGVLKSFQKNDEVFFILTTRGVKAFFAVAHPVYDVIEKNPGLEAKEISAKVALKTLYGGVHKVYSVHEKLVEKIILLLLLMGFIQETDGMYKPKPIDYRIKAIVNVIKRLSATIFIRRPDDLVLCIVKSLNIPVDRTGEILNRLALSGIVSSEREPAKALADLLSGLEARADASLKEGRLLEAAAYEALAMIVADILSKLDTDYEELLILKNKYKYNAYERLGDYFYHNLLFEVAQTLYNRAVNIARSHPELAKEAYRSHAKYILSKARNLAHHRKYNEAISELQRLIEYYASSGSFREAEIARALSKELQAELEIMHGKSCIAKDLYYEASQIYRMLGSEYENKAKAMYCKALISSGECKLLVEKDLENALKIFEEAIKIADEILSPHLKNAALSWYYEVHARISVNEGKLEEAAKDFEEAAKYYQARGVQHRALLSLARAMKFYGFHNIFAKEFDKAHEYMYNAENYYSMLLKKLLSRLKSGKKDSYMFGEAVKGICDTIAIKKIIEALKILNETPLINNETLTNVINKLHDAAHYLVESSRDEYKTVLQITDTLSKITNDPNPRIRETFSSLIDKAIEELETSNDNKDTLEPRKNSIRLLLTLMLTRIKYSLSTFNRGYEEEIFL
ncbi:hypothetical protein J4526_08840 [Desulfurococcaceae archaeon MEX13E-LK6-19]|nr:hypothetical protein J4526_08840 [Desulfurococcaceae archaeon MEX13E-LK6-19]